MFFNPRNLVLGATALFAGLVHADDCENGPWNVENLNWVGGGGGQRFCATKYKQGVVIKGVEVWGSSSTVDGIQFTYSDDSLSPMFGKQYNDRSARLNWDPATDTISQLKLWGNGRGEYLGRIYMRLKSGGELNAGKETGSQTVYEKPADAGIMLGAFGSQGDNIDSLGVLFLKSKVVSGSITDMDWKDNIDQLRARKEGIETVSVAYMEFQNNMDKEIQTFTFSNTREKKVSKKYTVTNTNAFGVSIRYTVSAKVFDIGVEGSTSLSYNYTNTRTEEPSTEQVNTLKWESSTVIKPGGKQYCMATAQTGSYKGDYTCNVNFVLEDGSKFAFKSGGTMEQVAWSQAAAKCQSTPLQSMPRQDKTEDVKKKPVKFLA